MSSVDSILRDDALAQEVVVVTGAASGIGASLVPGLARLGASVACLDLDLDRANDVAAAIGSEAVGAFEVDVTDARSSERVAEAVQARFGPASVLVNSAGIIQRVATTEEGFAAAVERHLRVNTAGSARMIESFLPQLLTTRGRVVNLGSIASYLATPGGGGYGASKGGVMQLTKVTAMELAPHGVRVNAIAPGMLETPLTEAVRSDPERAGRFLSHTPMQRFGRPDELLGAIVFLATELSSYVTGITLPIDGGYLTV